MPTGRGGGSTEAIGDKAETATDPGNFNIWKIGGNPWQTFGRLALGGVDTCLIHPHHPTSLDFLLHHLLPLKDYLQGGGSHQGKGSAGIDPEDNQDHPEDITSRLDIIYPSTYPSNHPY